MHLWLTHLCDGACVHACAVRHFFITAAEGADLAGADADDEGDDDDDDDGDDDGDDGEEDKKDKKDKKDEGDDASDDAKAAGVLSGERDVGEKCVMVCQKGGMAWAQHRMLTYV